MFAAEEMNVRQAFQLFIVGDAGRAIAEANLRPQIQRNLAPAIGLDCS